MMATPNPRIKAASKSPDNNEKSDVRPQRIFKFKKNVKKIKKTIAPKYDFEDSHSHHSHHSGESHHHSPSNFQKQTTSLQSYQILKKNHAEKHCFSGNEPSNDKGEEKKPPKKAQPSHLDNHGNIN
jgi:hypothetical protein